MSVLHEVLAWSKVLKPCLRDALRRLLQNASLSKEEFDDLYALLQVDVGIPDPQNRVAVPLDKSHLPADASQGSTLRLLCLKNLKHVNRIAEDQRLDFAQQGLTVIYGDNGSGKSGYSRVLKLACRARDQKATVLPNAHLPKAQQGIPEAKFVVDHGGKKTDLKWQLGKATHLDLSSLSVFDSTCARAYVDADQDVAYLPYGLDLVENLARVVLPELAARLKRDLQSCVVDLSQFEDLAGTTKVGKMLASLSPATADTTIEDLATLDESEVQRLAELTAALHESDPKAKASALRRTRERLLAIQKKIVSTVEMYGDAAVETLTGLDESLRAAVAAEELAADAFRAGESLLPGTGGAEWQLLFDAARRYAAVAYADKAFPISDVESRCLLCQQELTDGASRLSRFEEFIKNDTSRVASTKRAEHAKAVAALASHPVEFGIETALIDEVRPHSDGICDELLAYQVRLEERRNWLQDAMKEHRWSDCPAIGPDPGEDVVRLCHTLLEQAEAHDLATNADTRQGLEAERNELEAQSRLAPRKTALLDAVAKLRQAQKLQACEEILNSRPISNKSKELTDKAVTQALSDALNREFASLRIQHLKTKLTKRASDGKTFHKLVLDVPNAAKVGEILSEGELRAMAIASFLAELAIAGHDGGAIFDDPVSSLDHFRRGYVAQRLVEEAKTRQVVVFTHDTVFLGELQACAVRMQVDTKFSHLQWMTSEFAGYCNDGLPWHHQRFDDRVDALGKMRHALKKDWIPNPSDGLTDRMRDAYGRLRATIERAVESIFMNGVVRRFDSYIPVKDLQGVVPLTGAEFDEVYRLFKRASDVTNAHDPASGANIPAPDPDEFEADINALVSVVKAYRQRKAALT